MKPRPESTEQTVAPQAAPAPDAGAGHAVPAADAAALSLVLLLVFCVVCFVWGAAILRRRLRNSADEHAGGPDTGYYAASPSGKGDPPKPQKAPWERDSDWWKK